MGSISDNLPSFNHQKQPGDFWPSAKTLYPDPDGFGQSLVLSNAPTYPFDPQQEPYLELQVDGEGDLPQSSRDDLSQFLNESAFEQMTSSPVPFNLNSDFPLGSPKFFKRIDAAAGRETGQSAVVKAAPTNNSWPNEPQTISLADVASGFNNEGKGKTTVLHGQLTPGDSPALPPKAVVEQASKPEPLKHVRLQHWNAENPSKDNASVGIPVRKTRKPRKSSKKKLNQEQEAEKREMFLKRNREAAHKCRIKKKNQTEEIAQKVKNLDADNAMKGLQIAKLRREVEALKAVLLPHYRECNDERLVAYMDASTLRSPRQLVSDIQHLRDLRSIESAYLEVESSSIAGNDIDPLQGASISSLMSDLSDAGGHGEVLGDFLSAGASHGD